jgi:Glycosyl transferases group 1
MKLLAVAGDMGALITQIRLTTPLTALSQQTGWTLVQRSFHDCTRADIAAADVLIVQRGLTKRAWRLQRAMRLRGGAVVYEIDDLLTELPGHISNHAAVQAQQAWLRLCLLEADVVTVTTPMLAQALGQDLDLRTLLQVPNYALPMQDAALPAQRAGQAVTLLFASMERLASDFIYTAVRAIQGPDVRVVVVGPLAQGFVDAGVNVQAHALMPRADFMQFARSLPNVLAVIPLEDSRFAACKSALKWFEYSEAGIPVLCSNVSPYREVVQDGVTGRLVHNNPVAWQTVLTELVADANARQRLASGARSVVRERFTLAHTVNAWQEALQAAVQRRTLVGSLVPGMAWRVQDLIGRASERTIWRLRQFNRARLLARQQRREQRRQQRR